MTRPDIPGRIWDHGMQPERTNLAWRRAAASLLGVGLATPKVAWASLGDWSFLAASLVVSAAAVLLTASHRRYSATHDALTQDTNAATPDGALPALTAAIIAAIGLLGAYTVLTTAQGALGHA